jgi:V8-like Glu-specific endopeptidase
VETRAVEAAAAALLSGQVPDGRPWETGEAVTWIADALTRGDAAITAAKVRSAVEALNSGLLFEHTRLLGDTWRSRQDFDPTITRRHAQALIELSALDGAETVLKDGLARVSVPDAGAQARRERLEYEGLLGRIDKQRFVETGDLDALGRATERYLAQYHQPGLNQPERPYWHGINAVALLAREEREGVGRQGAIASGALAKNIYEEVAGKFASDRHDVWLAATACEASLARGDCDQAEFWLYRLLHHPRVRPFHVNSLRRQLQEIWQASPVGVGQSCADRLTGILTRHLMRTDSRFSLSTADLQKATQAMGGDTAGLEKNFSGESGFTVDTIKGMLAACRSIGCVTNTAGERLGTGFLVNGGALKEAFGTAPVFVTNAHVISSDVANAIRPDTARITFELESVDAGSPRFYSVADVLFTSPPGASGKPDGGLDVTVVRLAGLTSSFTPLATAGNLPLIDAKARAYVIGHPRGSGLQISLQDSLLLDIDDDEQLVHYRTPTDPGSSGSPVFNKDWQVIALHHSGSSKTPRLHGQGFYEANEGIALSSIKRRLNSTQST